jgi:hypothetical protein
LTVLVVAGSLVLAGCTGGGQDRTPGAVGPSSAPSPSAPAALQADVQAPAGTSVVAGTTVAGLANAVAASLFRRAPVAVVVSSTADAEVGPAAATATRLGVPVLVDGDGGNLAGRLAALGTTTVLRVRAPTVRAPTVRAPTVRAPTGQTSPVPPSPARTSSARSSGGPGSDGYPGVTVVASADQLPVTAVPSSPLVSTTVLVRTGDAATDPAVAAGAVVTATAKAAGARVVDVVADDPRSDTAAISALQQAPQGPLLAVGAGFGTSEVLTHRVAVARTGVQLPGGGQTVFPGRALVALYGYPGSSSLGVLGEQGPSASVARAQRVAAPYAALYDVPVVPTFEIIATVASGSPGADGDYSNEAGVATLQPLVDAATAAGMYVVLDLQPGRADLVTQAQRYASLLARPNVGLALDPEWALGPDQVPLQQIGSVTAQRVNAVVTWLSDLTAAANLPQKLLVLHQFRLSMITDEAALDTTDDDVTLLIHADGQGGRSQKEATWHAIVRAAPAGIHFGWKNFYDEDPQIASPADTVRRHPVPLMVSYQ